VGTREAVRLTPDALLPTAMEAVSIASEIMRTSGPGALTPKGDRDIVSEVDLAIERRLREHLHSKTPEIGFLGEEDGPIGSGEFIWALDPVDGTINFVRGLPLCAVSLALLYRGRPVVAVIDLPFLGTRYHATDGGGAFTGPRRLRVAESRSIGEAVVAFGDFAVGASSLERNRLRLDVADQLANRALRVRMLGSAAIDLAWLAEGRIDASITLLNLPWDMAAGVLLAREAGAAVVDEEGAPHVRESRATLAASPSLIDEVVSIVRDATDRFPGGL
jgi:myo-inositol-1(or 4)-monophosphatase